MGFSDPAKSKKLILAGGAIILILGGFFALKFMTADGGDVKPEITQTAPQPGKISTLAAQKTSPAEKKESPSLMDALKEMKDPFRTEDTVQDKLSNAKKEIEYLKASLEEKKLRLEIREIEKSLDEAAQTTTGGQIIQSNSTGEAEADRAKDTVTVKGILFTEEEKSVLLISEDRKDWVHEGEYFGGWEIKQIYHDHVVLSKAGRDYFFYYDRTGVTRQGEQ
jgi:hypothetical protein